MTTTDIESPIAESFAAMFEESLQRQEMRAGEVITAEVTRIDHNFVVVNLEDSVDESSLVID